MRKIILLMLLMLSVFGTVNAFADKATITADINVSGRDTRVTGNISTGSEKQIFLYVTDLNGEKVYTAQKISGENGAFVFSFKLPDTAETKMYNFYIGTALISLEENSGEIVKPETATVTATATLDEQTVTISGTISTGAGKQVSIQVINPNGERIHVNQIESGENGSFYLRFKLDEAVIPGQYTVMVGGENVDSVAELSFLYSKNEETDEPVQPEEATITATVEVYDRDVTIAGNISTGAGEQIILSVIDPNGKTVHTAQSTSETDGAFSFDFDLSETFVAGTYSFYLGTSEQANKYSGTFIYTSLPDADENFRTTEATYSITSETGTLNRVIVNVSNMPKLSSKVFLIEYDADKLELIDACGFTTEKEKAVCTIAGTDIKILSAESGRITFIVDRETNDRTVTSGVVNMLIFRKLADGQTVVNSKIGVAQYEDR